MEPGLIGDKTVPLSPLEVSPLIGPPQSYTLGWFILFVLLFVCFFVCFFSE